MTGSLDYAMPSGPLIKNVYHMLAYAFRALNEDRVDEFASEEFDHLHDLFAEILTRGIRRQLKQGLQRDYVELQVQIPGVRGQIDATESIRTMSFLRGQLVCRADEFLADTPFNRILRSAAILLVHHPDVATSRRYALANVLAHLAQVKTIDLSRVDWARLSSRRVEASYRLLLGVCRLIASCMLPSKEPGGARLRSWLPDEKMSALFEAFVRAYYRTHRPDLEPRSIMVQWATEEARAPDLLPQMRTDVTLRSERRTLIIDTKYYRRTLQQHHGSSSYRSGHLYQIHAYVMNHRHFTETEVAGMLLYAATTETRTPDEAFVVGGHRFQVKTLDLNQPWTGIRTRLDALCSWVDERTDTPTSAGLAPSSH